MEEKNSKRTRVVKFKLSQVEYVILDSKWQHSTCRTLSEYIRKMLFNKPVITIYRNQSIDDALTQMSLLKSELNALGNNFNQTVKKLHTIQDVPELKRWIMAHDTEKEKLFKKVEEVKNVIRNLAEKWLQ